MHIGNNVYEHWILKNIKQNYCDTSVVQMKALLDRLYYHKYLKDQQAIEALTKVIPERNLIDGKVNRCHIWLQ